MANAVVLYYPGDEDRARWLVQTWVGGRVTLCPMYSGRRRIALGARSVLIGLWSRRAQSEDDGRQLATVLAQSRGRAMLVVWDGRPPLDTVTTAGIPVIVASPEPHALMQRLRSAAEEMTNGKPQAQPTGWRRFLAGVDDDRARVVGIVVGAVLAGLIVIGGLAPIVAHLFGR